jgi:hypothetical protein
LNSPKEVTVAVMKRVVSHGVYPRYLPYQSCFSF